MRGFRTSAELSPLKFDTLSITIEAKDVTGLFEGEKGAALSELEVIGQVTGGTEPSVVTILGDANCDEHVNITDAIGILNTLFLGAGPVCCEVAADTNRDGSLNITDSIELLSFLFRGTLPEGLTQDCARVSGPVLSCDQETCP